MVGAGKPCLFVGESGTAKSVTILNYLGHLDATSNIILNMNFSSRTSSWDVQRAIEDSTEKRTKVRGEEGEDEGRRGGKGGERSGSPKRRGRMYEATCTALHTVSCCIVLSYCLACHIVLACTASQDTYGPPMGKRLVMFIDDLNMPRVDLYGTQQPIALLKLFVERKGLYDRGKELGWKHMKDVQVAGAMGPPGGARNPVDPRFMSLFNVFEIQFPSNDNLRTIYQVRFAGKWPPPCSHHPHQSTAGHPVPLLPVHSIHTIHTNVLQAILSRPTFSHYPHHSHQCTAGHPVPPPGEAAH